MGRRPLPKHRSFTHSFDPVSLSGFSKCFHPLFPSWGQVTYVLLTRLPLMYPEGPHRSTCMH